MAKYASTFIVQNFIIFEGRLKQEGYETIDVEWSVLYFNLVSIIGVIVF